MTKNTPGKENNHPQETPEQPQLCKNLNTEQTDAEKNAEHKPNHARIALRCVRTTQEALRLESPRYPTKCKRWTDIEELRYKGSLTELLRQGKTLETVANYLNCSMRQLYRAMEAHNIPTARAYAPALLEHKLNLNNPKRKQKE